MVALEEEIQLRTEVEEKGRIVTTAKIGRLIISLYKYYLNGMQFIVEFILDILTSL